MGLAFVGESANPAATLSGTSATTQTCTRTVTAGNALIAFCMGIGTATTVTFSDGTNTWTTDTTLTPLGGGFQCIATGHALNVAGGSTTVTATWNASVHHSFVILVEVSGAKTASALEGKGGQFQNPGGTGTDALTSGNPSPAPTTTANTFVCGFICNFNNNVAPTGVGTGFTQTGAVKYTASMGGVQGEYKIVSATGTYPATFTCTTTSDNWSTFVVILAEAAAASQVPPPPQPGPRVAAAESWLASDVQVTRRRFTAPKIDAPGPINPNVTTDRIAADAWEREFGPSLIRRPVVVQPKIDNPPVLPWTSTADRIALDSWPFDYGAVRRPVVGQPKIDSPPPILPLSVADRLAAESWTPDDPRIGRRQSVVSGPAPSSPPTVGPPNTARAAMDTWPVDYGATRRQTWTDGAHDPPPPRSAPPLSAAATWVPDEVVPRPGPRTIQSVDAPPRRGPIATAWAAVESWVVEFVAFRRQAATDGAHDAPPPLVPRAAAPAATWQPEDQVRPRAAAAPQAPATVQQPTGRSQVVPAQTWEALEAPPSGRARFTPPLIDQPAPRVPFARAAADSWAPADDARLKAAQAPQGQQVDNPAPRGALASIRAALDTWLADAGAARRTNVTAGQVDQPPSFSPTGTLRTANESWTPPDTRLPPRYQPQLPPPTNQPTPIGNVNSIRALLDSWLMEFGWTRRPLFTAGQVDQPAPLPWTSTSDRVAFETWAAAEPQRSAARAPQVGPAQPPGPPATSARVAGETWQAEAPAARRAPVVAPASVDAPRSSQTPRRAGDTWEPEAQWPRGAQRGAPQATVQPPRARQSDAAAESWALPESGPARRPPVTPGRIDQPQPWGGGRIARAIAHATWEAVDREKPFRALQLLTRLALASVAHLRQRASVLVNPTGTRVVPVEDGPSTAAANSSRSRAGVTTGRTSVVISNGRPTKPE